MKTIRLIPLLAALTLAFAATINAAETPLFNCSCSGFGRRKRRVCNDSDFVILYDLTI